MDLKYRRVDLLIHKSILSMLDFKKSSCTEENVMYCIHGKSGSTMSCLAIQPQDTAEKALNSIRLGHNKVGTQCCKVDEKSKYPERFHLSSNVCCQPSNVVF